MRNLLAFLSVSLLGLAFAASAALADCDRCGGSDPCGCGGKKSHCDCRSWERPKDHCGCASQDYCRCKSKDRRCWGGKGMWVEVDACECSLQPLKPEIVFGDEDECGCGGGHPYESCFNGSSMLCDTGCGVYLPCKRVCLQCESHVTERTSSCGCDCHTDYCVTQECGELGRPRVVPWWFTGGQGNQYMETDAAALDMVQDQAGGTRMRGVAGSPEASASAAADDMATEDTEEENNEAAAEGGSE
jgi:hypothetical protein